MPACRACSESSRRIPGDPCSMRVLDLGCGPGSDLTPWGVTASDEITGLDIDESRLAIARARFPNRTYLKGAGERLPFPDESFDRVISSVAVPYMNIPKVLAQIHRTLAPDGSVSLSLHLSSFTMGELLHQAIPKPVPTLFRLYVVANGMFFYCTGRTAGFVNGRTESFQTERGMRVALRRAGFVDVTFKRAPGRAGEVFLAEARKPGAAVSMAAEHAA
jgi:ubiquinone/menaquinone biosynthesis C-methylase UbiE